MTQLIKVGYRNILESATIAVSSENASFPKYRLYDSDIAKLFKGNSTPNPFLTDIDQNIITDPGLEAWESATDLTSWAESLAGTSTVNRETGTIYEGTYSCRMDIDSGGNAAWIYQAITIPINIPCRIHVRYYNSAAVKQGGWLLQDFKGKQYLKADGTWTTTPTQNVLPNSESAWGELALNFTSLSTHTVYYLILGGGTEAASSSIYFDNCRISRLYPANRIIIPAGHNLNGLVLTLKKMVDDESLTQVDSWTADELMINRSFTEASARFWRLEIASPSSAPELAEMFLGKMFEFERNPDWGFSEGDHKNIYRDETRSGKVRLVKLGDPRRSRNYELKNIGSTQRADFEAWDRHAEGIKSIVLEDVNGNVFFSELMGDLMFRSSHEDRHETTLDLLEVL